VPAARTFVAWFQDKIVPGIRSYVAPVLAGLQRAFATVQAAIARNEPELRQIGNALRVVAEFIAARVAPIVGGTLGLAFRTVGFIIGGVIDTIAGLIRTISSAVTWVGRLIDKLRNSAIGKAASTIGSLFTGSAVAGSVQASRQLVGGQLTASDPLGGATALGLIRVDAGDVSVYIGDEPVQAIVRREVKASQRATARRIASGVRL
jgi:hypothetical protein